MKGGQQPANGGKKSSVVENIEKMERQRHERRKKMEEEKNVKAQRVMMNEAAGKKVDIDFELLLDQYKAKMPAPKSHLTTANMKISVCVRKRPLFSKEANNGEIDSISVANP